MSRQTQFEAWCLQHHELLRTHAGEHLAISLERGLVASHVEKEVFEELVREIPDKSLYITHADDLLND